MNKGYIITVYEITNDENALRDYAISAKKVIEKFDGKILVRGGKKIITEGKEFVRTVVIEFSSFEKAKEFFYSPEYQNAHKLLKNTVIRNHQIIEGA
jgi:uncharacterized protein (DUF1330 family)|tara:strand:- start:321 stop:611 length:291 start_codon:yes stop_codon:yes gene_type:complete